MSPGLKLALVIIACLQCISLSFILMGVTGGFDSGSSEGDAGDSSDSFFKDEGGNNPSQVNSTGGTDESKIPDKVVLLVIDALRLDFVTPENFPFLMGNLKKYKSTTVLKYDVKVDSPTVTLPRVKTLMTGKSPVYMDVLRNFQTADNTKNKKASGINQPNLISSLRKELPDLNLCFFGDETWLRLFPPEDESYSSYFKKWEGVTSFYVKDFYEVDKNVTRHLEDIEDCNFLILHYLGLDHIGHVHGPKQTDLLKAKLLEMDQVIQHLHSHLSQVKTKQSKNLMIVTGDHGMANVGGHGGSTIEEVLTPLIGLVVSGLPNHHSQLETRQIKQIDIAPTLASIWNVAIPADSRGQLILDLVDQFKSTDELANLYQRNCKHLLKVLGKNRKAATYQLWWSEIAKMEKPLAIKKYIELENELSSTLQNMRNKNSDLLASFVISVVMLLCMEMYLLLKLKSVLGRYTKVALGLAFFPSLLVYFSSSFIEEEHYIRHYLFPSLLVILALRSAFSSSSNNGVNFSWILFRIMSLHRFAMLLNQTGDKWSNLSDLNDFIDEKDLQWGTASLAVILIYFHANKTDQCSGYFKTALGAVYLTKLFMHYFDEGTRGELHWLLMDSKLQRLTFILILFHFVRRLHNREFLQATISSFLLLLLSLHRFNNLMVVAIVFSQAQLINSIISQPSKENPRSEKSSKSSGSRVVALLSRFVLIWFAYSAFFYQGNSNGLATVDVSAGYIGLESYSSNFLIGTLIFLNTYTAPLIVYMNASKSSSFAEAGIANGTAHTTLPTNSKVKIRSKEITKKWSSSEYFPLLLLLTNGAECLVYSCSIMIFQNHLFIWSVFVPKLFYLIAHSVVCAIISVFYMFAM